MKSLLRLEELAQFLFCLTLLITRDVPLWVYALLALGPDMGMLGYLFNPRLGAVTYNVLHHKGLALTVLMVGIMIPNALHFLEMSYSTSFAWVVTGLILYGHASMDRIFGYGLKFGDNFHHTHLGWIGKGKRSGE